MNFQLSYIYETQEKAAENGLCIQTVWIKLLVVHKCKIGHFLVLLCLCFKTSLSVSEFCMQFYFHANQSYFRENSFALRLALKH